MFIKVIIIIALVSVGWALISLRSLSIKKELKETKEKLKKGRVVFQRTTSSSSS